MESKTKKIRVRELRDWPPGVRGQLTPVKTFLIVAKLS
jgi:hypothetical protein